jgi:hypothetical protein
MELTMEVKELIFRAAHVVSKQKTPLIQRSQNFYILVAETLLNYDDQSERLKTLADCMFKLRPKMYFNNVGINICM